MYIVRRIANTHRSSHSKNVHEKVEKLRKGSWDTTIIADTPVTLVYAIQSDFCIIYQGGSTHCLIIKTLFAKEDKPA